MKIDLSDKENLLQNKTTNCLRKIDINSKITTENYFKDKKIYKKKQDLNKQIYLEFKKKYLFFLKKIQIYFKNENLKQYIKNISLKFIKEINCNFNYYVKFDIYLILKIFKTIIFFLLKEHELKNITLDLIIDNLKENDLFKITESYIFVDKILKVLNN